ncbi:MAG: AEC family transporter, partial [Rhodospirillales bacterium]|nr:AEC family transporter [Rhodospirillales bacterium]
FDWLFKTLDLLGGFAIPLMLVTLGVSLAGLKIASLHRAVWLSVFRLVLGFGVGWGLAEAFGFEGAARGVLIIECALPVAVFNFLFAQAHDNRPDEVASIVLVSTALSFMTLPALLSFLI